MKTADSTTLRALVVGSGIAGLALANALQRVGWIPYLIEKAPERRSAGYFVGVFASGRRTAERLGILAHMTNQTPEPSINWVIDRQGNKSPGISFDGVPGGPWMTTRGAVEEAAFAALDPSISLRYSTVPEKIEQVGEQVKVELKNTQTGDTSVEKFDLVVGADGLRSSVREMVFGPHSQYLRRLNAMYCAYEMRESIPGFPKEEGLTIGEVGGTVAVYPFKDRPPTALWSWPSDDIDAEFGQPVEDRLREAFGKKPLGPILERLLDELEKASGYVFDSVEQPILDRWSKGRVVLVGDSAWCPTLYSGLGISIAFAGAEALAHELDKHPGNVDTAIEVWEKKVRPYAEHYQEAGRSHRFVHAPKDEKEFKKRNFLLGLRTSKITGPILAFLLARSKDLKIRNHDFIAGDS